jgi:DNA repair protein RecN (Recombination protein N)
VLATLTSLRIKNLALVESLDWPLASGFVAVTGETGAGKSVILGALKLLLGERAEKSLIRTGVDACAVEAVFDVAEPAALDAQLEESGIEPCADGQLLIRRTFTQAGGNRQFVNGSPTTLAALKQLGDLLVDLHGPHDHQSLLSAERQLDLLDAYSHAGPARRQYAETWRALGQLREEHASLAADDAALARELDLLRHQAGEIADAAPRADEEAELQARYTRAANSRRLADLAIAVAQELAESEPSILSRLGETARLLREMERTDPSAAPMLEAHNSAAVELGELARSLAQYAERLDLDPAQLAEMEARVHVLQTLKRKYGPTLEDVLSFGEQAEARLQKLEGRGAEASRLEAAIAKTDAELQRTGRELSALRAKAAPALAEAVRSHLRDLGFRRSEFEIQLNRLSAPGTAGMESVEFLFAPNPGEPAKPLRLIASSGEISRVMLAVKSALADQDAVPLLVFDEIDANVGGEIAHAVGAKMRSLGERHQVLCITHLPQVAAAAQTQYVVLKTVNADRTFSDLREVRGKARVQEIARMLGGQNDAAVALAKSLLGG